MTRITRHQACSQDFALGVSQTVRGLGTGLDRGKDPGVVYMVVVRWQSLLKLQGFLQIQT
jgi:hypothetical protein